jgi:hypothetical protein
VDERTYYLGIIILVSIGLHVPDDLMSKELGELGCLQDIPLDIAEGIIA